MRRTIFAILAITSLAIPLSGQQKDDPNCKDHPLFTRMPDYWIHHCKEVEFDAYPFVVGKGKTEQVEGHLWQINYRAQPNLNSQPSELQIVRNFENAVKKQGGAVVYSEKPKTTFRLKSNGKEIWVDLLTDWTASYTLTILEQKGMDQDIAVNADALLNDLKNSGHAAVYGIYFDTGKSDLKPESEQAIGEIGKLLKKDANLKVFVVGHTDNVGGLESNMKLSQDRADAVMQALVKTHGIAASRMKAFGNGPYAPVSTNDTDEGKAKNRRVELVKQ